VFIDWVKGRRGQRLKGSDDHLFTGEFWSGVKGLELGLVDGLGDLHEVLRSRYGDKIELLPIAPRRGLFAFPRFGLAAFAGDIAAAVEDRAVWSRLGL
jgi:ClpP class serine protease